MLSLLLHLMLVGVGPVVDARLEAEALASDHVPVHVEDATDPSCQTNHYHHDFCLIRALHSMDAPSEGATPPIALEASLLRPAAAPEERPIVSTTLSALGPRAPPAA